MNEPPPTKPRERPLRWLEVVFLVMACSPTILYFTAGNSTNFAQAAFRIGLFLLGALGYGLVKVYQHFSKPPPR